ncbi:MAG: HAD-IC family P-type ATPase [Actinomycetaceae bacterium]|nr:HAD-IC family P-type ATPase [Arcanobacterium sp.]MDD7687253.1 HAD-IC family P-type ATPase [Actinomycetaceae bacterium]MDY5273449.1 HAD-IC family P-type ATPase [Arcanobacterium sp.]
MTTPPENATPPHHPAQLRGLSTAEVRERIERDEVNRLPPRTGKTVIDIVRSNLFTRINAILGVLLLFVITTGSWINCAFGLLIVVNSAIGIIQELRAKRTLESLSVIGEEHPSVLRDGTIIQLPQEQIVLDDVISLGSGKQIVVDGEMIVSEQLTVDESLLTGEADAVHKSAGDPVLSGSFVLAGSGFYRVTAVGTDSYAAQLTAQASKYTLNKSRLQASIDRILTVITWILVPVALASVISQIVHGGTSYRSTVLAITGALVPMVPEGLVLITSTAFALGVIRLGKHNCLVQELPAIEGLARVDTVCADKTGTLTEGTLIFHSLVPLAADADSSHMPKTLPPSLTSNSSTREIRTSCSDAVTEVLAHMVASDPDRNATTEAIFQSLTMPSTPWEVADRQPFSSATKWASVTFAHHGTWILGAPDILTAPDTFAHKRAAELATRGLRVLLLATAPAIPPLHTDLSQSGITPQALVVLEQKVRADAQEALDYFRSQDVALKVISGDNPASVAAVAARLGVTDHAALDARTLDSKSPDEFGTILEQHAIFGRVRPDQKRHMVKALQKNGHTVAMTGDGVNDVLALKDADIGVAMGSGSSAARAVAKIVLLDNRFATLPLVVSEGRRVIANIERVANLFLTKTTYSALLAVLVLISQLPFPFQPIHVTITGWFTIGLPAFILSLPPNNARAREGFTTRVLGFALPSGVIVAASSFLTYLITWEAHAALDHTQQSTAALLALIIPSVWVLACVARPWNLWKVALFLTPVLGYGLIFLLPATQQLFMLDSSNMPITLTGLGVGLFAALAVEGVWHTVGKRLHQHSATIG